MVPGDACLQYQALAPDGASGLTGYFALNIFAKGTDQTLYHAASDVKMLIED
jgi:hypothetical protein